MLEIPTVIAYSPECQKAAETARQKLLNSLSYQGIDAVLLANKLKEELNADETKVFSGKEGLLYSTPLTAWKVRQEARKDAHKLLDHYPADRQEHYFPNGPPIQIGSINPNELLALQEAAKAYARTLLAVDNLESETVPIEKGELDK